MSEPVDDAAHGGEDLVQADVAALYGRHYETMCDAALSVLAPNGLAREAEDAVHAVAFNLVRMRQRGRLTPREDWGGYLWKASRNEALKIVRDRRKSDSLDQHLEDEDGAGEQLAERTEGHDPVGEEIEQRDRAERLWEAMAQLALDQRSRRIVTGYYFFNMTDAQLGDELGISGQRVGVIRRGVQRKLAEQLRGGEQA